MDFTFNNINIRTYFDKGENPPISEFKYLHSHPLVRPNFILQLETQMLQLNEKASLGLRLPTKTVNEITDIAITIGTLIADINKEGIAEQILSAFRRSYILCNSLGIAIKPA